MEARDTKSHSAPAQVHKRGGGGGGGGEREGVTAIEEEASSV